MEEKKKEASTFMMTEEIAFKFDFCFFDFKKIEGFSIFKVLKIKNEKK